MFKVICFFSPFRIFLRLSRQECSCKGSRTGNSGNCLELQVLTLIHYVPWIPPLLIAATSRSTNFARTSNESTRRNYTKLLNAHTLPAKPKPPNPKRPNYAHEIALPWFKERASTTRVWCRLSNEARTPSVPASRHCRRSARTWRAALQQRQWIPARRRHRRTGSSALGDPCSRMRPTSGICITIRVEINVNESYPQFCFVFVWFYQITNSVNNLIT